MDWDHFDQIPKAVRREPIQLRRGGTFTRSMRITSAIMLAVSAIVMGLLFWLALPPSRAHGRELYSGQYAQVDPAIRKWFRDQKIPGTQSSCCSESDGVYAEEDIREGHYWTRFVARQHNDGAADHEVQSE